MTSLLDEKSRATFSHTFLSHLRIKDDSLDDGRWFVDDTDCNSECNDDDDDHKDDDYEKRVLSRKQFLAVFFSLCTTVLFLALAGLSRDERWRKWRDMRGEWWNHDFLANSFPGSLSRVELKPGKEILNLLSSFHSLLPILGSSKYTHPLAKIKTEVCTGTLLSRTAPKALPLCILMRFEIS